MIKDEHAQNNTFILRHDIYFFCDKLLDTTVPRARTSDSFLFSNNNRHRLGIFHGGRNWIHHPFRNKHVDSTMMDIGIDIMHASEIEKNTVCYNIRQFHNRL